MPIGHRAYRINIFLVINVARTRASTKQIQVLVLIQSVHFPYMYEYDTLLKYARVYQNKLLVQFVRGIYSRIIHCYSTLLLLVKY